VLAFPDFFFVQSNTEIDDDVTNVFGKYFATVDLIKTDLPLQKVILRYNFIVFC